MSDVSREEFEALKDRVAELEAQTDSGVSFESDDGLDHRDKKVLAHMRENGKRSKIALVNLYQRLTDIQNTKKAKTRAKNLEQHTAYTDL